MLLKTTKYDYAFIIGIGVFTVVLELTLLLIFHNVTAEESQKAVSIISGTVIISMGVYSFIVLTVLLADILRKKFKLTSKNLKAYGLRSGTIISVAFVDLATFLSIMSHLFAVMSHSGNELPIYYTILLQIGVSSLGLYLAWNLRKQTVDYVEDY